VVTASLSLWWKNTGGRREDLKALPMFVVAAPVKFRSPVKRIGCSDKGAELVSHALDHVNCVSAEKLMREAMLQPRSMAFVVAAAVQIPESARNPWIGAKPWSQERQRVSWK